MTEKQMEYNVKVVSPEAVMESLLKLLDETEYVPLVISGSSMTPFLAGGRDIVYLSKPDRPLRRGDMVLYQRANGAYVLHRILSIDQGMYTMIGDAQTNPEPGIRPEQIRALIKAVRRKGKLLKKGSFWWDFFENVWIRMVSMRPVFSKLYSTVNIKKDNENI